MPIPRDAPMPELRRAGWLRRGYAVAAVDRWGATAADALALPPGPDADAAIAQVVFQAIDLGTSLGLTGDRYREGDVDALIAWVASAAPEPEPPANAAPPADGAPLRAQDVVEHRFGPVSGFSRGYSADHVDEWLDEAAAALGAHEAGEPAALAAADVGAVRFALARGAAAYPMDEVDALLDRVAGALSTHEARAPGRR